MKIGVIVTTRTPGVSCVPEIGEVTLAATSDIEVWRGKAGNINAA